jgi:hypothetical protein
VTFDYRRNGQLLTKGVHHSIIVDCTDRVQFELLPGVITDRDVPPSVRAFLERDNQMETRTPWEMFAEIIKFCDSSGGVDDEHAAWRQGVQDYKHAMQESNKDWLSELIVPLTEVFLKGQLRLLHRTLLWTCQSQLGLCAGTAAEGDLVVLLAGCSFPVILRPKQDNFIVVGAAIISGMMQGKMWPKDKAIEELQTFILI